MEDKNSKITDISRNSISCIETIYSKVEDELSNYKSIDVRALATVNTLNDTRQIGRISEIDEAARNVLHELSREPVIARISYEDEDGGIGTLFISRASPKPVPGFKVASYRSPAGRIAALPPGEEFELRIGGEPRNVVVKDIAKLHPTRSTGEWDSRNTEIEFDGLGSVTVASLRALLESGTVAVDDDLLAAALAEDDEPNILSGIRRGVLTHMGLRDQPILDKYQDEIFRLPIDSQCFLSGPPGTGKTTTLIRRLGQKLDIEEIQPNERSKIERISIEATPHQKSWLMFSPTELLRQYVKEAFAREGVAASDEHIRTWDEFRNEIARGTLGILRTGTGGGQFVKRPDTSHLDMVAITGDPGSWFDDFEDYRRSQLLEELKKDADWLTNCDKPELNDLGSRVGIILDSSEAISDGEISVQIAAFSGELKDLISDRRTESEKIVNQSLNRILHEDREFLDKFAAEISRQPASLDPEFDEDDPDSDLEDDDDIEETSTRNVSRRVARNRYERAVRALAKARSSKRKISAQSANARLLDWLGPERVPDDHQLDKLAIINGEQTRLRKFARTDNLLLKSVSRLYKKFRKEMAKEGDYYLAVPDKPGDVSWHEIDIIVLAMLRVGTSILTAYEDAGIDIPNLGTLANINSAFRNQILVDEATDFSAIQLAIMYSLSPPSLRSFFACGDFNQRLTEWGVANDAGLDWLASGIARQSITVSYRQTGKLVELAKAVAELGGSTADNIVLPDRLDIDGVTPIWQSHLGSDGEVAEWLTDRIREIESVVRSVPSIAVLVKSEDRVEPIANALNEHLQEVNLSAVACKDGKVVGNDHDVRVFDIQHIKGLEFEAVFFADLDEIIDENPSLYDKYIYVGATRAATYLGATFKNGVPKQLENLTHLFGQNWQN